MLTPELEKYALEKLSKAGNRDDLVAEICTLTHLSWERAEALLARLEAENQAVIARRQFPLLFSLATILFLAGLGLSAFGIYGITLFFRRDGGVPADLTSYFMPIIEQGLDPGQALGPAVPLYLRTAVYFILSPFSAAFFGAAMLVGSLLGMRRTWSALFDRK